MATNYFKSRRETLGLTQQQVADAFGVTSALVSAWERGITVPQVGMLTKASEVYRTSVANLVKAIDRIEQAKRPASVPA